MKREEIHIRDPFVLPYEGKYYLYGTGIPRAEDLNTGRQFWCYISEDLEEWSEPILCFDAPDSFWAEKDFWAPEVHRYNDRFYMLASFKAEGRMRATQALVADKPQGPFQVVGEPLTPPDWMSLDGTLYIEEGIPYLVFCHEWVQIEDGEIVAVRLKEDLSGADGTPRVIFKASESQWAKPIRSENKTGRVTDGPFLCRCEEKLTMFWSSFSEVGYSGGMAVSESGKLAGPWKHQKDLLFQKDGGHGMVFDGFDGKKYFTLHQPNIAPLERVHFYELQIEQGGYILV